MRTSFRGMASSNPLRGALPRNAAEKPKNASESR